MKPTRKLTRRSFLGRVAGGAVGGAVLIAGGASAAEALQVSDNDSGANSDPAGRGRTGVTDNDSGSNSDRPNHGRGRRRAASSSQRPCTDNDTGRNSDPQARGRGTGYSDSDSGRNSDRPDCGRRR
jgi:hypothetical protein